MNKGTTLLKTTRLTLRRFNMQDLDAFFTNWASNPNVCKYLTWPPHKDKQTSKIILESWLKEYEQGSYNWAIVLDEINEPIGSISVVKDNKETKLAEIGYCIGEQFWHKGYTSEALSAVIDYLFDDGYLIITAKHDLKNPNSGKVLRKVGMKFSSIKLHVENYDSSLCDYACYILKKQNRINFLKGININNFNYDPYHKIFDTSSVRLLDNDIDFKSFVNQLNVHCKSLQSEDYKEVVGDDLLWEVKHDVDKTIIKDINNIYDVALYAASLNILNTFVKQKVNGKRNKIISYYFKSNVLDVLVNAIIDNEINDVIFDLQKDGNMSICYIKVYDLIYSFHEVSISDELKEKLIKSKAYQNIEFDNIRKQKVAVTLYKNIKNYQ